MVQNRNICDAATQSAASVFGIVQMVERWIKRVGVVAAILFLGWQAVLIDDVAPILAKLIWLGLPLLMIYLLFV